MHYIVPVNLIIPRARLSRDTFECHVGLTRNSLPEIVEAVHDVPKLIQDRRQRLVQVVFAFALAFLQL